MIVAYFNWNRYRAQFGWFDFVHREYCTILDYILYFVLLAWVPSIHSNEIDTKRELFSVLAHFLSFIENYDNTLHNACFMSGINVTTRTCRVLILLAIRIKCVLTRISNVCMERATFSALQNAIWSDDINLFAPSNLVNQEPGWK